MKFKELPKFWKINVIILSCVTILLLFGFVVFQLFLNNYRSENERIRANCRKDDSELIGTRLEIPRNNKKSVKVNIYIPQNDNNNKLPVIFNIHGGGFVGGDADLLDTQSDRISNQWDAIVVAVNYTKADVKPIDYGVEEIVDAIKYFREHNEEYNADVDDIIKLDWMNKMSTYNIKFYYTVFKYGAEESQYDNIQSTTLNYSLMYFINMITILILNYIFILHINLLDLCENFKITTPSDYALLIHGVPIPENNEGKIKEELIKIVKEVSNYVPNLDIYQIIPCLRIAEIYDIALKKYEYKKILYHLENFEKQKKLNRENNYSKNGIKNDLHYFKNYLICNKEIPYQEIEKKFEDYSLKLDSMLIDLNQYPNKYNGGTFFLIFSTMNRKKCEEIYIYYCKLFINCDNVWNYCIN